MLHTLMLLCLFLHLNQPALSETPVPVFVRFQPSVVNIQMQTSRETQAAVEKKTAVASADKNLTEQPAYDYKEELKKMGFYKDETKDGKLNLRNAILRFQSNCNLEVNGLWNDKCHNIMALRLATGVPAGDDLIKKPPTDGIWITINKSKRILTLYKNSIVLQKYPVAIGNPASLTPDGKFTVANKIKNPYWGGGGYAKPVKGGVPENPLGYRWLGLSYKDGRTLGIHGNNEPYSIGKNVSHGCIRMINSDAEELFDVVPLSAPVWIGTDGKLEEWGVIQPEYGIAMETAETGTGKINGTVSPGTVLSAPSTGNSSSPDGNNHNRDISYTNEKLPGGDSGSTDGETPNEKEGLAGKEAPAVKTPGAETPEPEQDNESFLPKERTVLPDTYRLSACLLT
ncbi:MAG: L,D-transpeptidase [Acetivibrionales bacterium]|jgi:lipoprotein-anchoring transpeptidase ErfK/SrfK